MPDADPRDEELVRRYLEGDGEAFASLVKRHERRVYNLSLRMTGSEEDARDATQDAFLSALRKLSSFRGEAAFTTWMHRVTVNACYDVMRKKKREPMLDLGGDERERSGPEPAPAPDIADASDLSIDVQRALLAVPEDFRVVMLLHDVRDLPQQEIAAILQIAVGTVKSRLHRGRVALAEAMGIERERPGPRDPSDGAVPR